MNVEVCAAIVAYHPSADFERAVALLRPQVGRMVVVDNHSGSVEIEKLKTLAEKFDFALIENPDNFGLGKALNQSIEWTKEQTACEFILFLDQDSFVSEHFVAEMVAEYRKHSAIERIFLVMPAIVHRRTGDKYTPCRLSRQIFGGANFRQPHALAGIRRRRNLSRGSIHRLRRL